MPLKGRFFPRNPHKYMGNVHTITFRSTWERTFMEFCDTQSHVQKWVSEEIQIPYYFPGDRRWHRYFVDFLVQVQVESGTQTWLVEVKPSKQLRPPKPRPKVTKSYIRETVEYARNQSKWAAARAYCQQRNWKFLLLTEKDLYNLQ